jgi:ribose/xylose/arabinose/galactoside ABC-type transport system permease subunit
MTLKPEIAPASRQGARLAASVWTQMWLRLRQGVIYLAFIVLVIGFSFASPEFLSTSNMLNIGRQTAIVSVIAFAMTFVLTAGEIDLSIGSVMAVSSLIASLMLRDGSHWLMASLAGLVMGLVFGLFNGLLTTRAKIPSFLVTLGSMGIARGVALTLTDASTIAFINDDFARIWGAGDIGMVPTIIIWVAIIFVIAYFFYNHTIFGRYVQATGGNLTAARFSGINTDRIKLLMLMMSGLAAGLAGLLITARLYSGRPYVGQGLELDVIAAVILGGTSLFGGRGTIVGTLVGALLIGVVNNGLVLLGIATSVQMIIKGAIIIAAVFFAEKTP